MVDVMAGLQAAPPSEATTRLLGLANAVKAARGRIDHDVLDPADELIQRGIARLQRSSDHTIVALAGATGSGKSSLFNALTDLEIAGVGVRRPTTSWTLACAWGPAGGDDILEWIGIPPRHRVSRMSMLDRASDDTKLDGLILLDLPDHDSTEVAHHLEMERLVQYADLVVWVLDPQKYADAVIHERYIRPMASHVDTTLVVLNQIDKISFEHRATAVGDVQRLIEEGGLTGVKVLGVSATRGDGIDDLKRELSSRIRSKDAALQRLTVDIAAAAEQIAEASGTTKISGYSDDDVRELRDGLASAAGVDSLVDAVSQTTRRRTIRKTSWLPLRWVGRLSKDPMAQLARKADVDTTTLIDTVTPTTALVQRSEAEAAVRRFADRASQSTTTSWALAIRDVSTGRSTDIVDELDEAIHATEVSTRAPGWAGLANLAQFALLLAALAGGVWWLLGEELELFELPVDLGTLQGISVALWVAAGALVAGLLLSILARIGASVTAKKRAAAARSSLAKSIDQVQHRAVVAPVREELERYDRCRDGLSTALR